MNRENFVRNIMTTLLCTCFLYGCNGRLSEADAKKELTGRWLLNVEHNCRYGAVEKDELVLHEGGRMEQHLKLKDGREFRSENERWSFVRESNVSLESRWSFPADSKAATKESESLIVEFSKQPVIVLDPDSNCFYMKVR